MQIFQATLAALALTFLLFVMFYAMIFGNYIKFYGINEFFNPFFGAHFNAVVFFGVVVIFAFGLSIRSLKGVIYGIYGLLFACVLTLGVPSFGRMAGQWLLADKKDVLENGQTRRVSAIYESINYIYYLENGAENLPEFESDINVRKNALKYYQKQ